MIIKQKRWRGLDHFQLTKAIFFQESVPLRPKKKKKGKRKVFPGRPHALRPLLRSRISKSIYTHFTIGNLSRSRSFLYSASFVSQFHCWLNFLLRCSFRELSASFYQVRLGAFGNCLPKAPWACKAKYFMFGNFFFTCLCQMQALRRLKAKGRLGAALGFLASLQG